MNNILLILVIFSLALAGFSRGVCANQSDDVFSSITMTKEGRAYQRAVFYYKKNDYQNATKYIDQAIDTNPMPEYLALKGQLLFHTQPGRVEEFAVGPGKAMLSTNQGLAVYGLGLMYNKRFDMAAKVYRLLIRKENDNGNWLVAMGQIQEASNSPEKAIPFYQQALTKVKLNTGSRALAEQRIQRLTSLLQQKNNG